MDDKLKSNFVILGAGRSGSTVLCSTLNKQKQINCVGEIFNIEYPYYYKIKHETLNNFFESKAENKPDLILCDKIWGFKSDIEREKAYIHKYNNFKEYINILSKQSQKQVFGYKIFDDQFIKFRRKKDNYLQFLKDNNSKILFLIRANLFLQYISMMTAYSIDTWNCNINLKDSSTIYQLNPIQIDYLEYVKFKKSLTSLIYKRMEYIKKYNLPYIPVVYEHFTGEKYLESFEKIFKFLNLDFNEFIDLKTQDGRLGGHKKINVYNLKDKIENFNALRKQAELHNDLDLLKILDNG